LEHWPKVFDIPAELSKYDQFLVAGLTNVIRNLHYRLCRRDRRTDLRRGSLASPGSFDRGRGHCPGRSRNSYRRKGYAAKRFGAQRLKNNAFIVDGDPPTYPRGEK